MREYQEQSSWIKWVRLNYPNLTVYHIPNGEKRDIKTGVKLKNMGVLPGVFDLYCMDYKLYIEFKTETGKLSDDQKWFSSKAKDTGHDTMVCFGFEDGVKKFTEYVLNISMNTYKSIEVGFKYDTKDLRCPSEVKVD